MRNTVRLLLVIVVVIAAQAAQNSLCAQPGRSSDHMKIQPIDSVRISPLGKATIVIRGIVEKGWHTYGVTRVVGPDGLGPEPMEIIIAEGGPIMAVDTPSISSGAYKHRDEVWGTEVEEVAGSLVLNVPITAKEPFKPGRYEVKLSLVFQMCDGELCLPPEDVPLSVVVHCVK